MFWGGERFFEGENYFLLPGSGEVGGRINSAHPNAKRWGHNELGSPPQDGGGERIYGVAILKGRRSYVRSEGFWD